VTFDVTVTPVQPLAVWQTEPCPTWCVFRHDDDEHPEDRTHFGETYSVKLLREPAVDYGSQKEHDWQLTEMRAYLRQHIDQVEPVVSVMRNDGGGADQIGEFRLCEAADFGRTLRDLVAEGRRS
jgi:hypothetical protein